METHTPIVILGGGLTGLGAAYLFHQSGFDDWVLYERDDEVGGLSRSFLDDHGFTWDVGGHIFISHYGLFTKLIDEMIPSEDWIDHECQTWNYMFDQWLPCPFEQNLHLLPDEHCARCLEEYIHAALNRSTDDAKNADELLSHAYGEGIADLYFRPYQKKFWTCDLKALNTDWSYWIKGPSSSAIRAQISKVVFERDKMADPSSQSFRFPRSGGTGRFCRAIADRLPAEKVVTSVALTRLNPQAKRIYLSDGNTVRYEKLISSLPVDRLAAASGQAEWMSLAGGLRHSGVQVVGLGLKGSPPAEIRDKTWMFFPEANVPFYRVSHLSHCSPKYVRDIDTEWSLLAEIAFAPGTLTDERGTLESTIRAMTEAGLIEDPNAIQHTWMHRAEYAQAIPTLDRDEILHQLLPELNDADIFSRGRFGAWKSEIGNKDHSFMQGVEAAAHILHGSPEFTVWHPKEVNTKHPVLGWDRFASASVLTGSAQGRRPADPVPVG